MDDFENAPLAESLGRVLTQAEVEQIEAEARTAAYHAEIGEIAELRKGLRSGVLHGQEINWEAKKRGREILAYRVAVADAIYHGTPLPDLLTSDPVAVPAPVSLKPLPWPKSGRGSCQRLTSARLVPDSRGWPMKKNPNL